MSNKNYSKHHHCCGHHCHCNENNKVNELDDFFDDDDDESYDDEPEYAPVNSDEFAGYANGLPISKDYCPFYIPENYIPNTTEEEIDDMLDEYDSYVEPGLRHLREVSETGLPKDVEMYAHLYRVSNAYLSKRLAEDMAQTYQAHIATILEANTQFNIRAMMQNRENEKKLLYTLLENK